MQRSSRRKRDNDEDLGPLPSIASIIGIPMLEESLQDTTNNNNTNHADVVHLDGLTPQRLKGMFQCW